MTNLTPPKLAKVAIFFIFQKLSLLAFHGLVVQVYAILLQFTMDFTKWVINAANFGQVSENNDFHPS